jgi:hypothetical protein
MCHAIERATRVNMEILFGTTVRSILESALVSGLGFRGDESDAQGALIVMLQTNDHAQRTSMASVDILIAVEGFTRTVIASRIIRTRA